jgi:O-antigen/teichoic acid export membrane protein
LTERDRSTVFWTAALAGLIFTAGGIALSYPISRFYGEPAVRPLFAVLAFSFVVTSLGTTQRALLMRDMNFKSLEVRLMVGSIIAGIVGIAAAAIGYGPWAIILQQLTVAVVSTILLWRFSSWRPSFTFSAKSLRDLGGFSGNVFGQRLLYYLHLSTATLLIGKVLGAAPLGAYSVAYSLVFLPFAQLAVPIAEVLFPAFARIQTDRRQLADMWVRATRLVAAVSVPCLVGLAILARDFVHVVLGTRWSVAIPVIQVLAAVGIVQSLQTLNGNILQALDRTGLLLRYTIVFFFVNLAGFAIGLHWGVVGVAGGYAVASVLVEPGFNLITSRALGISAWALPRSLLGVVQASAVMAAFVYGGRLLLTSEGIPAAERLVLLVVLGTIVYLPVCAWRVPELLGELRSLRRR